MTTDAAGTEETIRVDRWLWFARFFKSRNLATKLVQSKKVRLNSAVIAKASVAVRAGDVLTFPQEKSIRVVKIITIGTRRGPAPEAQALYEDIAPKESVEQSPLQSAATPRREKGAGRPTKADRRAIEKFRHDAD